MTSHRLIGLLGAPGSGKGAVKRHLERAHGFTTIGFTDAPRRMLEVLGLTGGDFEGAARHVPIERFGGSTPNHLLSSITHAWGRRMVHTDLWAGAWGVIVDNTPGDRLANDLRYPNEGLAVRKHGGVLWRIVNPTAPVDSTSERAQLAIPDDAIITNDGDLHHLHDQVDFLLASLP